MKNIIKLCMAGAITISLFGCTKKTTDSVIPETTDSKTAQSKIPAKDLENILKLGLHTEHVVKIDSGYLVEGDIFISFERLARESSLIENGANNRLEQYRWYNIVTGLPRTIKVTVNSNITPYTPAVDQALTKYNNLNLNLKFQRVSSGGDIEIIGYYEVSNVLGFSSYPFFNGNPYNKVNINTYRFGGGSNVSYLTSVILHELGHAIGLAHTDYMNNGYSCGSSYYAESSSGLSQIPNTNPNPDPNSFMLACANSSVLRTINAYDAIGLTELYGRWPGKSPVLCFYSQKGIDHHLRIWGNLYDDSYWKFEGINFYAYNYQAPGTVPIYRFYSNVAADNYYTQVTSLGGGSYWSNEGVAFYAYPTQVPGTVPIYCHYSPTGTDHYFTPVSNLGVPSYWRNEGVVFYAFP